MIFQYNDYRSFLKTTLEERSSRDRKYSLRAMAAELGLGHSSLCEVMKGKKNLSPERAAKVAEHLNLSQVGIEYFCLLVSLDRTRDESLKNTIREKIKKMKPNPIRSNESADSGMTQIEEFMRSETFHIDYEQLPVAKQMIEGFYSSISKLSQSDLSKNNVYRLGIQFRNLNLR